MTDSETIYKSLCRVVPGGVSSPFRSFVQVGGLARVLVKGKGSRVWDADGKEYLDLCCGWGPLTLGHAHPAVVQAVCEAATDGVIFGAPTPWELELAEVLQEALPSLEMLRFVNSGAEAVSSALRVARSATGRTKVIKFEGGYHGHVPPLDAIGFEAERQGGSMPLGVPEAVIADTLLATYNDLESVERFFQGHPDNVACVVLEPVTGSMGVIEADQSFLEGLRELCDRHSTVLIFDEVLSGFRVARGGAQSRSRVRPDLTCLGKAVAGGLPIGVYGGRADLMKRVAPVGPVYQAGTFCANPLALRAGLAAQREYRKRGLFELLEERTAKLCRGIDELFPSAYVSHCGGMFSVAFGVERVRDHRDALKFDEQTFAKFFHAALEEGVYFPPSTWDAAALSTAHDEAEIDEILERLQRASKRLQAG